MGKKITRRSFIKTSGAIGVNAFLGSTVIPEIGSGSEKIDIAIVKSKDYFNAAREAVRLMGGIQMYVPENAKVALLPNPGSGNPGSYTKPEILRAAIQMCKEAGAAQIAVIGWLPMRDWIKCGSKRVIDEEGIDLIITDLRDESQFMRVPVPKGVGIKEARLLKTHFKFDRLIDLPITKEHSGNKYSGALKNMMGMNSPKSCQTFHRSNWVFNTDDIEFLEQCIADLNTVIRVDLCIADATEFLITNGPSGPGKLSRPQKVLVGTDRVAIDAYCATLFGLNPQDVIAVKRAYAHGLGEMDLSKINIKEIEF